MMGMNTSRAAAAIVLAGLLAAAGAAPVAAQSGPPIDVQRLGPQVGDTVPDFRLPDQRGAMRSRDELMGAKGLMLVFSRSADWCPYCKTQIAELQSRLPDLTREGLGVAVVTYDPPAVMADFAARRGITLPLLSDRGSAVIRAYGILNTTVDPSSRNMGIPFPGTFLLDRQGVVTARFFEEAYQERHTVASILLQLGGSGSEVEGRRVTTDHAEVTTYLSDHTAAPGTIFSLVAEVTPRSGVHVYAPGNHDYRVVSLRVDPQPFLLTHPVEYPASEIYYFAPLDERVPVYTSRFRLLQPLFLSAAPDARKALASLSELTITGTLEYQACDDQVCFLPKTVPLSHTIRVQPLDTERPAESGASR
jgi:peroxiredoxin